jgi:hypothetical protein
MALVRILVDGYSLLHSWPELAPGKARHSQAARDELIHVLTRYQDACGTPVTVIFDGAGSKRGRPQAELEPTVEVLYSRAGQTADQMIERATHRFQEYGEVLCPADLLPTGGAPSPMAPTPALIVAITAIPPPFRYHLPRAELRADLAYTRGTCERDGSTGWSTARSYR